MAIDVDALLQPIDADAPSGPDLEYDPEFQELERLARGKPEQQYGDTIIPAEEPDWRAVGKAATALLSRTKDLRVAALLARSALRTSGFADFAACIRLMHDYLDQNWESVHPQLDPDDNDATMRVNSLITLCDPATMLREIRDTPLVESRRVGRFALREFLIAKGELPASNSSDPPPTLSTIEAAFADAPVEQLQATATALTDAISHVSAMETKLMNEVGSSGAADFSPVLKQLRDASRLVQDQMSRRGISTDGAAGADGSSGGTGADMPVAGAQTGIVSAPGEIRSRQDVIAALGRIRDYYERHEPSSPLPLLMTRAERLVNKSFIEILTDFAPDGVAQAKLIGGVKDDADNSY